MTGLCAGDYAGVWLAGGSLPRSGWDVDGNVKSIKEQPQGASSSSHILTQKAGRTSSIRIQRSQRRRNDRGWEGEKGMRLEDRHVPFQIQFLDKTWGKWNWMEILVYVICMYVDSRSVRMLRLDLWRINGLKFKWRRQSSLDGTDYVGNKVDWTQDWKQNKGKSRFRSLLLELEELVGKGVGRRVIVMLVCRFTFWLFLRLLPLFWFVPGK